MTLEIQQEVLNKRGVYRIANCLTGDFYIGSTSSNFYKRYKEHITDYYLWKNEKRRSCCPVLYNAFSKYSIDNFVFSLIEVIEGYEQIRSKEEELIQELNPYYNICKFPSKSGVPNLGRKLSEEWKRKIGEKAKVYKHKSNNEIYEKKVKQNKDLSSRYQLLKNGNVEFEGSARECSTFLKSDGAVDRLLKGVKNRQGWEIKTLKKQKKGIKLLTQEEEKVFNSYGECDRFLNIWKGYTSEQVKRGIEMLLGFKYELL